MVMQPMELTEIERKIREIKEEIEVVERLLWKLKEDKHRAEIRLKTKRREVQESGIKY